MNNAAGIKISTVNVFLRFEVSISCKTAAIAIDIIIEVDIITQIGHVI
jgi:hypothetical protein